MTTSATKDRSVPITMTIGKVASPKSLIATTVLWCHSKAGSLRDPWNQHGGKKRSSYDQRWR